jgi:hypothetical protein
VDVDQRAATSERDDADRQRVSSEGRRPSPPAREEDRAHGGDAGAVRSAAVWASAALRPYGHLGEVSVWFGVITRPLPARPPAAARRSPGNRHVRGGPQHDLHGGQAHHHAGQADGDQRTAVPVDDPAADRRGRRGPEGEGSDGHAGDQGAVAELVLQVEGEDEEDRGEPTEVDQRDQRPQGVRAEPEQPQVEKRLVPPRVPVLPEAEGGQDAEAGRYEQPLLRPLPLFPLHQGEQQQDHPGAEQHDALRPIAGRAAPAGRRAGTASPG